MFDRLRLILTGLTLSLCSLPALAAAKDGEQPPLFASDPFSYIWNILMFLILLGVLWKFVWPKVLEGLQAREQKLRSDLTHAEQSAKQAEEALAKRQEELANAQKDAQVVIEEAKKRADQIAAKLKADAEAEIAKMKERAQAEIASAKDTALSEVYAQTAELSTQIASKILKREISAADQQQLVNDSLAELAKSGV